MSTKKLKIGGEYEYDIPNMIGPYEFIEIIGQGSFSTVFLVNHKSKDIKFACKAVSRQLLEKSCMIERFERELRLLQTFNHPNIVKLFDIIYNDEIIFLIMENCPNGELFQLISDNGRLDEDKARIMFTQIIEGMIYIHSKEIAHRDIKPENILLDSKMNPKIADFGLSHHVNTKSLLTTPCGSPFYAPPEVILSKPYDGKLCDVWSIGVVLYTISVGSLPWDSKNQHGLFKQIIEGDFRIPRMISPLLRDLITKLMSLNPNNRPQLIEVLKHPWMTTQPQYLGLPPELIPAQLREKKNYNNYEQFKPSVLEKKIL